MPWYVWIVTGFGLGFVYASFLVWWVGRLEERNRSSSDPPPARRRETC